MCDKNEWTSALLTKSSYCSRIIVFSRIVHCPDGSSTLIRVLLLFFGARSFPSFFCHVRIPFTIIIQQLRLTTSYSNDDVIRNSIDTKLLNSFLFYHIIVRWTCFESLFHLQFYLSLCWDQKLTQSLSLFVLFAHTFDVRLFHPLFAFWLRICVIDDVTVDDME